jgi:tetraacyldisaccharide 4'-kinase
MTADWLWYDRGRLASLARLLLAPAEGLWRVAARARNALFDRGTLAAHPPAMPVISVGNLTVGGTGKTPVAAYLAGELLQRGARPAVVLRGYGDDEVDVHRRLNPTVVVVADADRVRAVGRALRDGADVAVLDDGFQHRRLQRTADLVLVEAERWGLTRRCLPAGPFREPVSALRRATAVLVTQKVATAETAERVAGEIRASGVSRVGIARFRLDGVHAALPGSASLPEASLTTLGGLRVLAVSGVGNPDAWERQLAGLVSSLDSARYPDHHAFTMREVAALADRGSGVDAVICTLKDAVKLGRLWPRNGPRLLYVSQRVEVVTGGEWLARLLDTIVTARPRP